MILYPTLELLGGRCVSLEGGQISAPSLWHVDPIETARSWAAAGAGWMHITDFDAIEGRGDNADLIRDLIRTVGIPVQVSGGCRSADSVARWIDSGAGRVVVSTLASRDPEAVKSLTRYYPDQIVLSVDVSDGRVMTDGWRQASAYAPGDFVAAFNDSALAGVVVTDIDSDVADRDAQLGLISGLAATARAPVIASGVVRCLDDVARLKYVPNIAGALIGRALFRKQVDLGEALTIAQPAPEPVAEFI
ncbi:MAG: 1-(5-phosphoribosyl)-5-[(5-phosphoribosylamino)methylideneamino] imidazole-4-carboxamide isomerase [Aliishimia sp.]